MALNFRELRESAVCCRSFRRHLGALGRLSNCQQIFGYPQTRSFSRAVFLPRINDLLETTAGSPNPELLGRLKAQAEGYI